jgi:hypothetical protein
VKNTIAVTTTNMSHQCGAVIVLKLNLHALKADYVIVLRDA